MQKLNGRLTSLSCFLLKLAEKEKSFYKLLMKTEPFLLDEAYEQAFLAFKKTIAILPVLSRPKLGVPLLLYLTVDDEPVSSALVQEEGKHLLPIYFTHRILHDVEKLYQMIKKVMVTLITSTRHLKPYFQSYQVVVKTNYPIRKVLQKPKLKERMVAWFIELLEFDLQYMLCGLMKTQFMTDFLAKFVGNDQTT